MTNQQHPITPPPFELVNQWHKEACKDPYNGGVFIESKVLKYITTAAVQWGADQELEACLKHLFQRGFSDADILCLRAARRPKPPSLKEQALEQLGCIQTDLNKFGMGISTDTIRRALEQLND